MTFKTPMPRLDRVEAFKLALQKWGPNAVVGLNHSYQKKYHVGELGMYGVWRKRGVGRSWEEAFASVVDWPDGKLPRSHGAKNAPDVVP